MPATEQIRKKIRSLLLGASKSLEDAFRVHDDGLVLEVQCAVEELLTLFKEFHLSACDPYLRFNANGALTGFNILINFCTTCQIAASLASVMCLIWISSSFQIVVLVMRMISLDK